MTKRSSHLLETGVQRSSPRCAPLQEPRLQSASLDPAITLDTDTDDADNKVIAATNDGTFTWKEAHEQWTLATNIVLSPHVFGTRMQNLGGGKLLRGTSEDIDRTRGNQKHTSSSITAPEASIRPPVTANVSEPSQLSHSAVNDFRSGVTSQDTWRSSSAPQTSQPSGTPPSFQDQRATQPSSRPSSVGPGTQRDRPPRLQYQASFPPHLTTPQQQLRASMQPQMQTSHLRDWAPQPTMADQQYSGEIDSLKTQVSDLQSSVDSLVRRVDLLDTRTTAPQLQPDTELEKARDDSIDALGDSVAEHAKKLGRFDGMQIQLETLKRKVMRLEDGSDLPATPSKSQSRMNRASSNQLQDYPPSSFTTSNGVKRPAPADLNDQEAKRVGTLSENNQYGPDASSQTNGRDGFLSQSLHGSQALDASQGGTLGIFGSLNDLVAQRPTATRGGHYGSLPRKRGRPRKADTAPYDIETRDIQQYEQQHGAINASRQHNSPRSFDTNPRGDGSNLVRRGTGGDRLKTRRKPVRNEQGLLVRADGRIDKRSRTSAHNIRKRLEPRGSGEDTSDYMDDSQVDGPGDETPPVRAHQTDQSTTRLTDKYPNKPISHDTIMKRMFPKGVDAEAHTLNHAEQLFNDRSPELPRPQMQRRDEMRREDGIAATSSPIFDFPPSNDDEEHHQSFPSHTQLQQSKAPSITRDKANDHTSIGQKASASLDGANEQNSYTPSTKATTTTNTESTSNQSGQAPAAEVARMVVPNSNNSTDASKVSNSWPPSQPVAVKDSQQSYRPSEPASQT